MFVFRVKYHKKQPPGSRVEQRMHSVEGQLIGSQGQSENHIWIHEDSVLVQANMKKAQFS